MRKLEIIENSRLFQGLPAGFLRDLASSFRFEDFPERVLLAQTGRSVERIGVVLAGSAEFKVLDRLDHPVRFLVLTPGQCFGEMAAVDDGCSVYDIKTLEPLKAVLISRSLFVHMVSEHSTVLWNAYQLNLERLRKLCLALVKHEPMAAAQALKGLENSLMGDAIRYIEGRFDEQLTLDEIARISNMSRFHFARRFKEATGHSFKEFLNRRRVQEAKNLMKRDGLNISQACYAVGFGDLSYFGRVFRKIEGQSPSRYKKGLKQVKSF